MEIAGRRLLLIVPMIFMIIDLIALTVCLALQVRELHTCVPSVTFSGIVIGLQQRRRNLFTTTMSG